MKKVTLYTTNEEALKKMLTVENAIDWSTYFLIGGITFFLHLTKVTLHINLTFGHFELIGCDVRHAPMLKETAASRDVHMKGYTLVHLMTLPEPNHVPELNNR